MRNNKEERFLLKGGIEHNERRANILFDHKDNEREKKKVNLSKMDDKLFSEDSEVKPNSKVDILNKKDEHDFSLKDLVNDETPSKSSTKEIVNKRSETPKIEEEKDSTSSSAGISMDDFKKNDTGGKKSLVKSIEKFYKKHRSEDDQVSDAEFVMRKTPSLGVWGAELLGGEEASELFKMSYAREHLNTDYAKKHKRYSSVDELEPDLKDFLKEKISNENKDNNMQDMKGIRFNFDTEFSNKLANDKSIHKFVRQNAYNIRNNIKINDSSLQFENGNTHNAIGRADVRKIKELDNGDLYVQLVDVYDFDANPKSDPKIRAARRLQDSKDIIPYFSVFDVIIPRKTAKDLLN